MKYLALILLLVASPVDAQTLSRGRAPSRVAPYAGITSGDYYADPAGSGSDCTIGTPCTYAEALTQVQPGETILLRAGDHVTHKTGHTDATTGNRITVASYGLEVARIVGQMNWSQDYYTWRGVEFTIPVAYWAGDREVKTATDTLEVFWAGGDSLRIIDSIIHNTKNTGAGKTAANTYVSGSVFYGSGRTDNKSHAWYTQNTPPSRKVMKRTLMLPGFTQWAIHVYGTNAELQNFLFDEFAQVGSVDSSRATTMLVGGEAAQSAVDSLVIQNSLCYDCAFRLGQSNSVQNGDAYLNDVVQGYYGLTKSTLWDNIYQTRTQFSVTSKDTVAVWPSEINGERAIVLAWNSSLLDSVSVDLSSLSLIHGKTYRFINLQNRDESQNFVYSAKTARAYLRSTGWTVETPTAHPQPLYTTTSPELLTVLVTP